MLLLILACQSADIPESTDSTTTDTAPITLTDTGELPESYTGPDYAACITDAQCEPGSWCTTVPGHASSYCAPPCDPDGDGSECAIAGFDDPTVCLDSGRCALSCAEEDIAQTSDSGELVRTDTDTCPETMECVSVEGEPLCAGAESGTSGYYEYCSHPNVSGTDCPDDSDCYGGSLLGLDDVGVCLPWCDDGTCQPVPDGVTASPYCYDAGLSHPVCALLCYSEDATCPEAQSCYFFGSFGICVPDGAEIDY